MKIIAQLILGIGLGLILGILYAIYLVLYMISLPILFLLPAKYSNSLNTLHKKRKAFQLSFLNKIPV